MKKLLTIILAIYTVNSIAQTKELKLGDQISNFKSISDNGKPWALNTVKSDFIVVYFYPAAMTSGCTKQACEYRDNKTTFDKMSVTVIGISGDEPKNLQYFKDTYDLNFTLLSDKEGSIAKKFGVPLRDGGSIDREIQGEQISLFRGVTPKRWTFILDKDRRIVYRNDAVNASEDSKTVQQFIEDYYKR